MPSIDPLSDAMAHRSCVSCAPVQVNSAASGRSRLPRALLPALLALATASCGDQLIDTRPPPPQLSEASLATLSLREDIAPGTAVRTFAVANPGPYVPQALSYRLAPDTDDVPFTVNRSDGKLLLSNSLDYEAQSRYELPMRVSHHSSYTDAMLVIEVVDVYEELTPLGSAKGSAPAEIAPGDNTGRVIADVSTMVSSQAGEAASYALAPGSDNGLFAIDGQSGELSLANPVAAFAAAGGSLTVAVLVRRGGREVEVQVPVRVAEALYFADPATREPLAPSPSISLSLAENSTAGTTVGSLLALHSLQGSAVSYALLHPSFNIDASSGVITASMAFDYEAGPRTHSLEAIASAGALRATLAVEVTITDANDPPSAPAVAGSPIGGSECGRDIAICLEVDENSEPDAPLARLVSSDEDGDNVSLALMASASSASFRLSADGALTLVEPLNREQSAEVELRIEASDGEGGSTQTLVVVTVGDVNEAPEWAAAPQGAQVSEGAPADHIVVDLSPARDPEGAALTYAIASGNPDGLFKISRASLALASPLDFETTPNRYSLTLRITDIHGLHTDFPLVVSVTNVDEPPTLIEALLSAPEDSPVNTVLGQVRASDPEGGAVTYAVASGAPVAVDAASGTATLLLALDYESEPSVSFDITLSDEAGNSQQLSAMLAVSDVDEPPVFVDSPPGLAVDVAEGLGAGAVIARLRAEDPEGESVSYSLGAGSSGGHFAIDSAGVLTLVGDPADSEASLPSSLTITASDGNLSANLELALRPDKSLVAPILGESLDWEIPESLAVGEEVAALSIEERGAAVTSVSVLDGADGMLSALFSANGRSIVLAGALDHESAPRHSLILLLKTVSGNFEYLASVSVTDVDEPPVFAQDRVELTRRIDGLASGSQLGIWPATDPEGLAVSYTIVSAGAGSGLFVIDAASGALSLARDPTVFEGEIVIGALDLSGNSARLTLALSLRVNEAPEIAAGQAFRLAENGPAPRKIGDLSATDPDDDPITWRLVPASEEGSETDSGAEQLFTVSANGGLTVNNSLNFEVKSRYTLSVAASDGSADSVATVEVSVLDRNDLPRITGGLHSDGTVPEDAGAATLIRHLDIDDEDVSEGERRWTLTFLYSTDDDGNDISRDFFDLFSGSATTGRGDLRLKRKTLDHELYPAINVTVLVFDEHGSYSDPSSHVYGEFRFEVTDVDEPPSFLNVPGIHHLEENAPLGSVAIPAMRTFDPEGEEDYEIKILRGNEGKEFAFDSQSRTLTTAVELDYESRFRYSFAFIGRDCQNPDCTMFLGSTKQISVCVLDVNEPPQLSIDDESIKVSLLAQARSVVYRGINAVDPESHPLRYSLSGASASGPFGIDQDTGELLLSSALPNASGEYDLTVRVCDVVDDQPLNDNFCGNPRADPYPPQCDEQDLAVSVNNADIQPPGLPRDVRISQSRVSTENSESDSADSDSQRNIKISWSDPVDSDYSHTLIRWFDSNGVQREKSFVSSERSTENLWQSANEQPATSFPPGLHRLEMVTVDGLGNRSQALPLRVRIVADVELPILLVNNRPLVDLHMADPELDSNDSVDDYRYSISKVNGHKNASYTWSWASRNEEHHRFRTAEDTTGLYATKCPPGWLCAHKGLAHYFNPGEMPSRISRERVGSSQYLFSRTEADEVVVRMQHRHYQHDIPVRIVPNSRALSIDQQCGGQSSLSRLDHWLCVNGREIIPAGMDRTPTKDEICALPAEIRQLWGNDRNSYQLVVSAEFDKAADVAKLFLVIPSELRSYWDGPDAPPLYEVRDGKWMPANIPVVNRGAHQFGKYQMSGPLSLSAGRLEFSSGYMEVRQLNKIPLISSLGPFFLVWSRYGQGHDSFSPLPDPSIFDEELRNAAGDLVDLDSGTPSGNLFLPRSTLGRVGFLEIDYWERWTAGQRGPLWVIHSYPYDANVTALTHKHQQRYTIQGPRAYGFRRYFYDLPVSGPFITGLELNPDAAGTTANHNEFDAIRFYRKLTSDARVVESTPDGLASSTSFVNAISHTAPMKISWRHFIEGGISENLMPPCHAEIYRSRSGDRLRCQTPRRNVEKGHVRWSYDYFRLWKRRGFGTPARLGGTVPSSETPVPLNCPEDGS